MSYAHPETLVESEWLAANLGNAKVKVVDGSWYMPAEKRDPAAEFAAAHIPGAVFFDIDAIADTSIPLPHILPDAAFFAAEVAALGIANDDHIICYDGGSMTTAARVWWTFRAFGHDRVSVLNGSLKKWRSEGRRLESGPAHPSASRYKARAVPGLVHLVDEMLALVAQASPPRQILDARSPGRFDGSEAEPRAGLRGGHMPGALNVPWQKLVASDGTMRAANELNAAFAEAGASMTRPIVTSCGSGVTASMLLLGLHLIGHEDLSLYDGSWSEWGSRQDTPIVSG